MLAEDATKNATRYVVSAKFDQAVLFFSDSSFLQFEHTSRQNRWAKASADGTTAEKVCQSIYQFRLNAKHLQLFFHDGSDAEFFQKQVDTT